MSIDKTIKIWNVRTGQVRFTLTGHTAPVNSCTISPDGKLIASASNDDTVKLWDSQTGQEVVTLTGHTGSVLKAAFSPDNRLILSVSKPTFRERQELLLAWLPNVEPFVLPGATHLLQVENSRGMAEGLAAFFARHPLPASARKIESRN